MNFEEFIIGELGEKAISLNEEQKEYLESCFVEKNRWSKVASDALNMQFNSKAGIDYTVTFEKAMQEMQKYAVSLTRALSEIKMSLGMDEEKHMR